MKQHLVTLGIIGLLFVFGGCATYDRTEGMPPLRISGMKKESIILRTEGSLGQTFSAVLRIDGLRREISGITPAEFPLECAVLVCEVQRSDGDGSLSFVIERTDGTGRFYTKPVRNLQRFRYHSRILEILGKNPYEWDG